MYSSILSRLSRVTVSQKFIPEIDGLRFLAILLVVLFHLRTSVLRFGSFNESEFDGHLLFQILSKGGLGVNLFFAISGFILAKPFLENRLYGGPQVNLKKYFLRRLTRLEPPYIIIMTGLFLIMGVMVSSFSELLPHYLASLIYGHMFIYGTWSTINPVAWSLETEVQFYIVAPLIAYIYFVGNSAFRYVLYLLIIGSHLYLVQISVHQLSEMHLVKSIVYYFSQFFIGFVAADLFLKFQWNTIPKRVGSDILGLLSLVVMFYSYYNPHWYFHLVFCASVLVLFYSVFTGTLLTRVFTNKTVTTIGGMCYTIYLVHYVFIFICVQQLAKFVAGSLTFYSLFSLCVLIVLPVLLIISSLIFYHFEKPFMYSDWFKRFRTSS
jgi:peptidoglycan/LPS O-acetylase OafA/YrhL